jgi:hypothetical protein
MSERIKELAEQVGVKYITMPKDTVYEKFAKLIVKECARIAAQTPCPYEDEFAKQTYAHTWDMACIESAKDIRKHFGVEE